MPRKNDFNPTLQDLKTVQGYLGREIKRLRARYKNVSGRIKRMAG
jgi:hypothetical protein